MSDSPYDLSSVKRRLDRARHKSECSCRSEITHLRKRVEELDERMRVLETWLRSAEMEGK